MQGSINIKDASGTVLYNLIPDVETGTEFESFVGTNTINNEKVFIYPNPTSDFVSIKTDNIQKINVYNSLGQLVIERQVNQDFTQIDFTKLNKGVYFISIIKDNSVINKKVIYKD